MSKQKKKAGRPEGARNVTHVIDIEPSRCKKCGSSQRSRYRGTRRRDFVGQPFAAIVYRRCKCLDCGQERIDREPVFEGKLPTEEENKANGIITSPETP